MIYALLDARQARGRPARVSQAGQKIEAKEFQFGTLAFTSNSKPVNELHECSITMYRAPDAPNMFTASLDYYLRPFSHQSILPFDLKVELLNERDKPFHAFFFTLSLGRSAERCTMTTKVDAALSLKSERLRIAAAVQACAKF